MPPELPAPSMPPIAAGKPPIPGGPGGPGGSPMLSPGAGLGAQASAVEKIKKLHSAVIETINAFPTGSKEQQALLRVAQTLSLFSREGGPPGGGPGAVNPGVAALNAPGPGGPPGGPPGLPGGPPMPGGAPPMPGGAEGAPA